MSIKGIVANFITRKRFGFIHYTDGEIFFHELDVVDGSIPQRGDHVEFELGMYNNRQKAVDVKLIAVETAAEVRS